MSRHRLEPQRPGRRVASPPSSHRGNVRPRYGRIAILGASALVTAVAVGGGLGLLPVEQANDPLPASAAPAATPTLQPVGVRGGQGGQAKLAEDATGIGANLASDRERVESQSRVTPKVASSESSELPANTGVGRRAVFSESAQRVWLVDDNEEVLRTYLVSGSVTDNLKPGTYEVYSRSEQAYGIDNSGTMEWFVRFTRGENAAIGFHNIPTKDGQKIQTPKQLGTPLSHGCIRQKESDALVMWEFAQMGTTVVVV